MFVRPKAFGDGIHDILLSRIMSLDIGPGERLSVEGLAREFQVSPTPIREALGRLEAIGLVVRTHLVGYSTAPRLTVKQFDDLFDLRLLIEPELAERAALDGEEELIGELTRATDNMRGAISLSPPAFEKFAKADSRFHELIALASNNKIVHETLARLHVHVHIFRALSASTVATTAVSEHQDIVVAISRSQGEMARKAMKEHIRSSRDGLRAAFLSVD